MPELLHLEQQGVENAPIVFIHGLASSGRVFALRLSKLAEWHNLLFPDLLGFGASPRPHNSNYDATAHVTALEQTLHTKANGQLNEGITLVAHSMGSLVALAYAARYPQHIRRIILFNPAIYASSEEARQQLSSGNNFVRLIMQYPRAAHAACLALCSSGLLGHVGPYLARRMPRDVIEDSARHSWPSLSRTLHNTIIKHDATVDLQAIKAAGIPLTVISGQYDRLVGAAQLTRLQMLVPEMQLHTIPTGHYPVYRRPDLVLEFLQTELNNVKL